MIRILVTSDFHAYSRPRSARAKGQDPSYFTLEVGVGKFDVAKEFIAHLESQHTEVDTVICCGDLIDKTDISALQGAWDFANKIAQTAKAKHLLICTGNHDVDSKAITNAKSPFEKLKLLAPLYPSPITNESNTYWSTNYFIKEEGDARYVILNTCSSHGFKKGEERGIFSPEAVRVFEELSKLPHKPINICVCHHHPHRHGEHELGEHDDMDNGQALTDGFSRHNLGHWLIVHGHKHHGKLSYAQGNSFGPIVFSAGSLSARLYGKLELHARNQYHLITIDPAEVVKYRRLVGRYQSWSWFPNTGWREAGDSEGLPASGGFGYRDILTLSKSVMDGLQPGRNEWSSITSQFEPLQLLTPDDLHYLLRLLEADGVTLETVQSVGKKTLLNLIR